MSMAMGNIRNQLDQCKLDTTIRIIRPMISRTQDLTDIANHYKLGRQLDANKTELKYETATYLTCYNKLISVL